MFSLGTIAGMVVRYPLRLLPKSAVVPVLCGANRSSKWVVGSAIHRCWLGFYEWEKQRAVAAALRPGALFFDVGANVGFYTLLAARRGCRVVAIEPAQDNLKYLQRHVAINNLATKVTIVAGAAADKPGWAKFDTGPNSSEGRLCSRGTETVHVITLDEMARQFGMPHVIKMDIEGGEVAALLGAAEIVRSGRSTIFVAVHGTERAAACTRILREHRYTILGIGSQSDELIAIPPSAREKSGNT